MRCLLAFLDPLLGCAPLIIETHDRPTGQAQVRDDKADSREQLPEVELHLSPPPDAPSSNWPLGRENPCTRPLACGSVFLRVASANPQCPAPGYRWRECGWRTSRPVPPALHRSPVWQRPRPLGKQLPCPPAVDARSPAT